MIKRLPLILFILTLASCGFMILIRISGSGLKLLSAKTGTGRFIAANYNSCIAVFIVILAAFVIVTAVLNRKRKKNKAGKKGAALSAADDTAFDVPVPADMITENFAEGQQDIRPEIYPAGSPDMQSAALPSTQPGVQPDSSITDDTL